MILPITILFALIDAQYLNAGYRFESHFSRWILRLFVVLAMSTDWTDFVLFSAVLYLVFDYALNYFRTSIEAVNGKILGAITIASVDASSVISITTIS
jgi:hypothetical protein